MWPPSDINRDRPFEYVKVLGVSTHSMQLPGPVLHAHTLVFKVKRIAKASFGGGNVCPPLSISATKPHNPVVITAKSNKCTPVNEENEQNVHVYEVHGWRDTRFCISIQGLRLDSTNKFTKLKLNGAYQSARIPALASTCMYHPINSNTGTNLWRPLGNGWKARRVRPAFQMYQATYGMEVCEYFTDTFLFYFFGLCHNNISCNNEKTGR